LRDLDGIEATAAKLGWPEPQNLMEQAKAEPYPVDALPASIRAAVAEVADFVRAPVALVAASALAAVSLAVQAHADVQRAEGLAGPSGLFLLTIADSGERKSTADKYFTEALRQYETEQAEAAKPIIATYRADLEAWEAKRQGLKDKLRQLAKDGKPSHEVEQSLRALQAEQPEKPRIPRLLYQDATPEALAHNLATGWPSGGVLSAEGGAILGAHGMQKETALRNLALLNTLWDGGTLRVDRKTSEGFTVEGARLTMGIQAQESALRDFIAKTGTLARGTGFFARFLFAWPESTQGTRFFTEPPQNRPALTAFNQRLSVILRQEVALDRGGLAPSMLILSHEAKALWVRFHDAIEEELGGGGDLEYLRDVASKAADNVARMAALFHIFEGRTGAIAADCIESAMQIVTWHLNEARRFLGALAAPPELADAVRLDRWLIGYCRREGCPSVSTRTIRQYGPLRDKEAIDASLTELTDLGRVRLVAEGRKLKIVISPALLKGAR
jgi:putative DNA primase/helicase